MANKSGALAPSDKVKKAISWLSEQVQENPDKDRKLLLQKALIRFDLSPAECAFLENNFSAAS